MLRRGGMEKGLFPAKATARPYTIFYLEVFGLFPAIVLRMVNSALEVANILHYNI